MNASIEWAKDLIEHHNDKHLKTEIRKAGEIKKSCRIKGTIKILNYPEEFCFTLSKQGYYSVKTYVVIGGCRIDLFTRLDVIKHLNFEIARFNREYNGGIKLVGLDNIGKSC